MRPEYLENNVAFAKTKIICHGAKAARIGERLVRHVWKYLKSTEFVKGNISENERKEMFDSISLESIISYPENGGKSYTGCDIVFQMVLSDDKIGLREAKHIKELSDVPNLTLVVGDIDADVLDIPYIEVVEESAKFENVLEKVFLDLFSVYTFPQEYGADFEKLRPFFEHKGKISTEKGEGFNLCAIRKASKEETDFDVIRNAESSEEIYILASRIGKEREIKYYSI